MASTIAISDLNEKSSGFSLIAVVKNKSELKSFTTGKYFTIDLFDGRHDGHTIRMALFNDAAEKYFPVIELNKSYLVQNVNIKKADKKYACINENGLELTANKNTLIAVSAIELEASHVKLVSLDQVQQKCFPNQVVSKFSFYSIYAT